MRIAMLLSGGVDSSVALARLCEEGHDVRAFYLKVWMEDDLAHLGDCPWEEDLRYARATADALGVPLEIVPFQREYHERVVGELVGGLARGRTPSPDVWCNERVKFGAFLEALPAGYDAVASGHYARRTEGSAGPELRLAADPVKDQTYFLCRLSRRQLARARFPIGDLTKGEVRRRARELGLPSAERPDSQGICFLGKIRYEEFVAAHLGERPGPIVEAASGRRLGEHRGLWFHTIGQRKGLGLSGGPWYVVGKDLGTDTLAVSRSPRDGSGATRRLRVPFPHWIGPAPADGAEVRVKVRHGPELVPARVHCRAGGEVEIRLGRPDPGLAPGQFAVVYQGDRCLGGGEMEPEPLAAPGRDRAADSEAVGRP